MIEDHWKPKLLLSLLPFLFLGAPLLTKECHGQAGGGNGNFFYYYSPTQRTNFNHGLPTQGTGQFFNNPFLNQQNHPQMTQHVPNQQQVQQPQSSMQFPSFQQSTLLGFNHPNFQQQQQTQQPPAFPQSPPSQYQFPPMQPTPSTQQPQQQFLPQTSPTFSSFTSFGPNAQFFGSRNAPIPQPSQSPFFPTQSSLGTVAPGAYNFFQSPFQYLQQRFLQDTTPTAVSPTLSSMPAMHSIPSAPTTTAVPPSPPAPTPTEMMMDSPALEQVIERRPAQKFSSRFRYVQQPPLQQQQQYNPYTRLGSPYTSDLPYMEQRFYSSPTSPTGYAYSLGGDQGNGATSTVHFSMGPLNKINQYLTEVSANRRMLQRQRIEPTTAPVQAISVPETTNQMVAQDEEVMPQNAPASPEPTMSTTMAPSTTTEAPTPAPSPSSPEPMSAMEEVPASPVSESMNSTLEPLLNEPSLQTETITAPVVEIQELPTARKASETSIPKRLVIRKKVARKRLRLDGSGELVDAGGAPMPVGVMIRRIVSSNRLPTEETKVLEDDSPKGLIAPIPATTPSPTTTTTTTTTEAVELEQMAHLPDMQPEEQHDDQLPQALPVEPQQSSSPQPMMMPVDESHMMTMEETPEEPQQPVQPISSTTAAPSQIPEEIPAMLENEPKEMPQPVEEMMSSTTTAAPIQPPPVEALMSQEPQPAKENDAEDYFEDYYEDDDAPPASQPRSEMSNPQGHSRIMTAVKVPESDDELPILNGVQKDDFPGVFHQNASPLDNSVETEQGEVINRITSSHPSESAEAPEVNPPAPESSPMTIPQNSTMEANQPEFMREDPLEEEPPKENDVPAVPTAFQPTSEANVPMMTTTPTPMMSSTTPQEVSIENSSQEQEDESPAMQPQEIQMDSSSTTEQPEGRMEQMMGTTMSTSTEGTPQQNDQEMTKEEAELPELMSDPVMTSVSSTTESIMMSSNADDEDSTSMPQMELANPSSTEIISSSTSSTVDNDEMVSGSSTTTVAPPSRTTDSSSSQEQLMSMDDSQSNNSQENFDESVEDHQPNSEEQALDSEEIGKAQRIALEETLKRLRERQQSSSTSDPSDDGESSPESEVQIGRKMFSRRPLQVSNLPLPTSGPALNSNAILHEDEHSDRSQVVEKIQRFRAKYGRGSSTTTKKPRRVTRPSPSTERRLAVLSPVEDLVGSQEQVDSFSDSSSTPGAAVDVTFTTTQPSTTRMPYRTTPMTSLFTTTPPSTTTMLPFLEESSTTSAPILEEEEINNPTYSTTTTSTESYEQQTTRQPPQTLTTRMTESTTVSSNDEFSSTTETDFETITERMQPAPADEMTSTTTSTTETPMMMTMTTTPPPALMERATTPSTTTSTTTYAPMTDFSDDKDMPKNDYDVFYSEDENLETAKNIQVSSSTETSTEAADDDMDSSSQSSPSSTTITPLSTSTDTSYYNVMTTTSEPNSGSAATTTMNPDMMTTTSAGQLIIHEILPTMPPLKEVSFVIGESVEDDQSAAVDNISTAETSDELLAADKAVVRVETNVHVSTNATTDFDTSSSVEQSSEELTPTQQPLISTTTNTSVESGEQGQRRVRIVVKRQRRLRRPSGAGGSGGPGRDGRRRRRKVFHRRPQ